MRRIALRMVTLAAAVLPVAALAQTQDHMTCFAVKDSAPRAKYQATLTTDAGSQQCIVRAPATFACVPTAASNVTPGLPATGPSASAAGAVLCYRAKCPKSATTESVQDEFGSRSVQVKASRFLCAPASVGPPTPGSPASPTTSTTLAGGGSGCSFSNGDCTGSCGAGKRCGTVVGTATCECRDVKCGDADAPACNGACSNSSDACIFSVTGCSCVHVP